MAFKRNATGLHASDGSVLILVLWILAILALLGVGLGYTTMLDQRLVSYQRDQLAALYAAKAGYMRALVEIEQDPTRQVDSLLDPWAHNPGAFQEATLGRGSFTVSYPAPGENGPDGIAYGVADEDRKINLNTAPKAVLARLPGMIEEIAEAVLDWREGRVLAESQDKPFEVLEELLLVGGITGEVFGTLQPLVTIYGDGKVNLNTAPTKVLRALGMSEGLIDKLLRFRRGLDGLPGTTDDQSFTTLASVGQQLDAFDPLLPQEAAQLGNLITQNRLKVTSSVFRIRSRGTARDGKVTRSVEAVVQRGIGASGSPTLLLWREY